MSKNVKKIFLFFLALVFLFQAGSVFALEARYPTIFGFSINDTSTLPEYARYLYVIIISLAGFAAVGAVAFGGVYYLVSYTRGSFTSEAKEWIKSGLLGLLIVVLTYLGASLINHNLVIFNLPGLGSPSQQAYPDYNSLSQGGTVRAYSQVPIGILTETLLTKTTDCYDFDPDGNPIEGNQVKTDNGDEIAGPTYLTHDRADCVVKLADAIQKKSKIASDLAAAINNLLDTCSCKGKCNDPCNNNGKGCDQFANPLVPGECTGSCKKGELTAGCSPINGESCCSDDTKKQTEHGPIEIGGAAKNNSILDCDGQKKTYNGLDEFRCPNDNLKYQQCDGIAGLIEKQVQINKQNVTVIDSDKWADLNLYQQLEYLKEKLNKIKNDIDADIKPVDVAKNMLNSKKCYLNTSSAELIKKVRTTDINYGFINIQNTFSVSAAKYCNGFNYAGSSCLKKCNDICPDTSKEVVDCYKNCADGDENCISDCYNSRPCTLSQDNKQTFSDCLSSCQDDCSTQCAEKYLECSDEYKICQSQCQNDSSCFLGNEDTCLINARGLKACSSSADQGNLQYCIKNSYLCQNGSNQFAGYQDCIDSNNYSTENYSSSFLYQNSDYEKCLEPNVKLKDKNGKNLTATCLNQYPETAKCPPNSRCADCPCNTQDSKLAFAMPQEVKIVDAENPAPDNNQTEYSVKVEGNTLVGPECNSYSYNDDPLTLFCESSFWTDQQAIQDSKGPATAQKQCSQAQQIPVGQAVDNAENWAKNLKDKIESLATSLQKTMDDLKKVSNGKDYCKCDSKYDNIPENGKNSGKPICSSDCALNMQIVPIFDNDGNLINTETTYSCEPEACDGNSCKQIMNYLEEVANFYRQAKLDYIDFYNANLLDERTDILKELTYSRQMTNSCSVQQNQYNSTTRLVDCTAFENNNLTGIKDQAQTLNGKDVSSYCYGNEFGRLSGEDLTDDWFCCVGW